MTFSSEMNIRWVFVFYSSLSFLSGVIKHGRSQSDRSSVNTRLVTLLAFRSYPSIGCASGSPGRINLPTAVTTILSPQMSHQGSLLSLSSCFLSSPLSEAAGIHTRGFVHWSFCVVYI